LIASSAPGATIVLAPSKDNTLYQDVEGDVSNGQGPFLYAGKTGSNANFGLRRGLIAFDLSAIPDGSIITNVSLSLFLSKSSPNPAAENISLHAALSDWGEGASNAGDPGGAGILAQAGDATWVFNFFNTSQWNTVGGDFRVAASATTAVTLPARTYLWSSATMISDVQAWVNDPNSNFGWVIRGNEAVDETAQRFNSSESTSNVPQLTITYTIIPEPSSLALVAAGALAAVRRRRRSASQKQ